jgi:hypothetical protein
MVQELKCYVCQGFENLDSHHITPIAYNGPKDGPQVMLCSNCHRSVHRAANWVYKPNLKIKRNVQDLFENPEQFERSTLLIRAIVSARIKMESSGRAPETLRRMQLEIPHSLHLKLNRKKLDLGFSSFQDLVLAILNDFANKD